MPRVRETTPDPTRAATALVDPARLALLERTGLLDAPANEAFDRLTRLAAQAIGAPVSLVSLVERGRQFFAGARGLPGALAAAREAPLSHSFCKHVLGGEPLVVTDARQHPLLRDNPAIPDFGVVAYAGIPLTLQGETLGSFCVIDTHPREWTADELSILRDLAAAAVTEAELRLALVDARERASRDSLTGLLNHGAFHERLRVQLADAVAGGRDLGLVLLDIDMFKNVNDTFGHRGGDTALVEVARRISAGIRGGDTLARVGGEEFAWILPDTCAADVAAAAERTRIAVSEDPIDGAGFVTISAGVACRPSSDDPGRLYGLADGALYSAKDAGRNRVAVAGPSTTPTSPGSVDHRTRTASADRLLLALRAREHKALTRVVTMAAQKASPEQLFAAVAEEVAVLMEADAGLVCCFEAGATVVVGAYGAHMSTPGTIFRLEGNGAVPTVHRTGLPARSDYRRLGADDPTASRIVSQGYTFGVAAPIHVGGERWGAVLAATTGPEPLDGSAEERLGSFSAIVGLVIAEAQERGALVRSLAEQAALQRIATMVARETDVMAVAAALAEECGRLTGATGSAITRVGVPAVAWSSPRGGADRADVAPEPRRVPIQSDGTIWGTLELSGEAAPAAAGTAILPDLCEMLTLAITGSRTRARLAEMADRDPLTGLPHHRAFHERLMHEAVRAHRHGRTLALVLCDVDDLAGINREHGHDGGDRVLAEVARRLTGLARPGDTIARVGGGQFAWILPECGELEGWAAGERLRAAVAAEPFAGVGAVTISAGTCDLEAADGADQLHRRAGGALYWAKRHGRDRVFLYTPDVVDALSAEERADLLERRQALAGVRMIARVVDAKDPATRRHSERVAEMARAIAEVMGWSPERAALLHDAGLVHDVGKIGVPDAILFKAGSLDDEEMEQVRGHAELGANIVSEVLTPEQTMWVRGHHERCDGRGYPDGAGGETVPGGARILALADSWDVMTVARHYGAPMSTGAALEECRAEAGRQFFPEVVQALESVVEAGPPSPDATDVALELDSL